MSIQSRFTSNNAIEFEFQSTRQLENRQTLFVSQVAINFASAPTTAGKAQLFILDTEGEDMIREAEAQGETHLSFPPALHITT